MTVAMPEVVSRVVNAANSHDTETFLASFVEDGAVDDWGREFVGADAIRGWSDREFIGANVSLTVLDTSMTANEEVEVRADVGGDGYNGPSSFTFALDGDHVSRMSIRQ
jgi:hypothetical protein